MKKFKYVIAFIAVLCTSLCFFACGGVIGKDERSSSPEYAEIDGNKLYFTLELRESGSGTEISSGDIYPHSKTDGPLIKEWEIPYYGATVYEAVTEYFSNSEDKITFKLSQSRYYMFYECVLKNGDKYNLETVYVAANGKYAMCSNFEKLAGSDGVFGTEDDLKVLTLVYKGWLY